MIPLLIAGFIVNIGTLMHPAPPPSGSGPPPGSSFIVTQGGAKITTQGGTPLVTG